MNVRAIPQVDAKEVRNVLRVLKTIEPTVTKTLRQDLRSQLSSIAKQTAEGIPTQAPMSGMRRGEGVSIDLADDLLWSRVDGKVSFTPGKTRYAGDYLVSIRVVPKNGRGVFMGELAGSRSRGSTTRGSRMINVLNQRKAMIGRGGRFGYSRFRSLRPSAVAIAVRIINSTFKKFEKEL